MFDDTNARLQGRYVAPSFLGNQTDRITEFASPKPATRLGVVYISEGSTIFTGRVAPQLNFSQGLLGGENQTFLLGPLAQYRFEEVFMPRNLMNMSQQR